MARYIVFASGSGGNCSLFTQGKTNILIDAGISARRIKNNLKELGLGLEDISAILLTHEHSDHICGIATLEKYFDIPIYASTGTTGALRYKLPVAASGVRSFAAGESFSVQGVEISTFRTPHDCAESNGYRLFTENGASLAIATDLGYVPDSVFQAISGAETVLLESNHDVDMLLSGVYPYQLKRRILSERGHLSNEVCGDTAARLAALGTKSIILGHLSQENNTVSTALKTVGEKLLGNGISPGSDIVLEVASAQEMSRTYIL